MERSEKTEKRGQDINYLQRQEQDESEEVLAVSLGQQVDGLVVSDTEDEEKQGCTPLITACRKGLTEVSHVCVKETIQHGDVCCCVVQVVQWKIPTGEHDEVYMCVCELVVGGWGVVLFLSLTYNNNDSLCSCM